MKNCQARDMTQITIRNIMRDAWLEGYNVKQIAGYFKLKPTTVYDKMSIKAMKLNKILLQKAGNL